VKDVYKGGSQIPVVVKILVVFGLLLIMTRAQLPLSLSLLLGSVLIGFWMGLGPVRWGQAATSSLVNLQTISLVLIVWLIMVMSRIMKDTGHMDRVVESFTHLSTDARTTGSVMTALIGLLPMPGGALFSAPLVESSLSKHAVTGEQKTLLNYWFRHIWEYWWPLYPGVALAVALLNVETWRFMVLMAPVSFICILVGVFFILRPMGKMDEHPGDGISWPAIKRFLWEIMPILIVVFVILMLVVLTNIIGLFGLHLKMPGTVSILPGLLVSIIWVALVNKVPFKRTMKVCIDRRILPMILLILMVMVFKGIMVESQAVYQIRQEMVAYKIPISLGIVIIPFISGLVTGLAIGFVGTSFPLIVPLIQSNNLLNFLSFAGLAYTFGYMGMILSPLHLCFLVSKDYYHASLLKSYRQLIPPVVTVLIITIVFFLILRAF
jgi:integral membrane protein (TIGR00529 family)